MSVCVCVCVCLRWCEVSLLSFPFYLCLSFSSALCVSVTQVLSAFVDAARKNEARNNTLERGFPYELALLSIMNDQLDRSRFFTALAIDGFLREWSALSPLMEACRLARLQVVPQKTKKENERCFSGGWLWSALRR
jgi:hypothetical protein